MIIVAEKQQEQSDGVINMDLTIEHLRTIFTADQLAVLFNAVTEHHDALRRNEDNLIGQLYDGDDSIVPVADHLVTVLGLAAQTV